jgi:hypothetical protein
MRLMLDEELARAVLIGDGRDVDDEDKIKDPMGANEGSGIRSILTIMICMRHGHGRRWLLRLTLSTVSFRRWATTRVLVQPTFYTTLPVLTQLMLTRDSVWSSSVEDAF